MDPASAIITFVTTGIQVIKLVKDTIDKIRDAPEGLRALQERIADVERPLRTLRRQQLDNIAWSAEDHSDLEQLRQRGKRYLDKITAFVSNSTEEGKNGTRKVKRLKWFMASREREDLEVQMDDLKKALDSMVEIVTLTAVTSLKTSMGKVKTLVAGVDTRLQTEVTSAITDLSLSITTVQLGSSIAHAHPQTSGSITPSEVCFTTFAQRLQCPHDCFCRCHAPFTQNLMPSITVPYFGRVNVSRRLLHKLGLSSLECNVQTCRRDRTTPYAIKWFLPFPVAHSEWFKQFRLPSLCISIHAPRVIPKNAEVWAIIARGDLMGLQSLFKEHATSIHDIDEDGDTLLAYACYRWHRDRSDDSQKIIKFLAEAGADLNFRPGSNDSAGMTLCVLSLATLLKYPMNTFVPRIRTDPLSTEICLSVFNINFLDLAMDVLEQNFDGSALQTMFEVLTRPDNIGSQLDTGLVWQQLGTLTPLDYAISYMTSEDALQILQNGADALQGAPMAMTVKQGCHNLLQPLLEAGADINAIGNLDGFSALHWACYRGWLDILQILIQLTGDKIDWHARTRDDKNMNALQLAKACIWWNKRPLSWPEEMFALLHEHGLEDEDKDVPLKMPGGLD